MTDITFNCQLTERSFVPFMGLTNHRINNVEPETRNAEHGTRNTEYIKLFNLQSLINRQIR